MKKNIFKILSLGLVLSFVLTACSSKPKNALAKVGKEYITAEEVNEFYNAFMAQQSMYMDPTQIDETTEEGKKNVQTLRSQVLESLIYEKTYVHVAKDKKIEVTDEEVNKTLDDMIEQAGGEETLKTYLESIEQTEEEFREENKKSIKVQTYITEVDKKLAEELAPSKDDIEKKLNDSNEEYFPIYNVNHILYPTINNNGEPIEDEDAKAKIKAEAQEVLDKISSGDLDFQAKFDEINSSEEAPLTSEQTQIRAEELGYFKYEDMVEPFSKAASEMEKDAVSTALVETDYGYHILKLNSKAENLEEAEEEYINDVKTKIESSILDEKMSDYMKDAQKDLDIKYYGADGKEVETALEAIEAFDFNKLNEKESTESKDKSKEDEEKSADEDASKDESEENETTQSTEKNESTDETDGE